MDTTASPDLSTAEILADYPYLEKADFQAVYASAARCEAAV